MIGIKIAFAPLGQSAMFGEKLYRYQRPQMKTAGPGRRRLQIASDVDRICRQAVPPT